MITKKKLSLIAKSEKKTLEDYIEASNSKFVILKGGSIMSPKSYGNLPGCLESSTPVLYDNKSCDGDAAVGDKVVTYNYYLKQVGVI